jgi:putative phage-type endonuclease
MEFKQAKELLNRENNGEFPKQKSVLWHNQRQKILTATNISSVLECNKYKSKYELMVEKLTAPVNNTTPTSAAIDWGNQFEPVALKFYEQHNQQKVYTLGLVSHSKYTWLGASPDGLLLTGKLLEIKCPFSRSIGKSIPLSYWIQMQIQMEVCDLPSCDYLECEFHQYTTKEEYDTDTSTRLSKGVINGELACENTIYWSIVNIFLKNVKRDKMWFATNLPVMLEFSNVMILYKKSGIKQLNSDLKNKKRKRSTTPSKNKKQKICKRAPVNAFTVNAFTVNAFTVNAFTLTNWNYWISASAIRNFLMDDPLIDWLEYYNNDWVLKKLPTQPKNTFQKYIMDKGVKFEVAVIKHIKNKFGNKVVEIANYNQARSNVKFLETVTHIKKGTPIIYQGVLHDNSLKIYGMPDLIVRSDYINKLFNKNVISQTSQYLGGINKNWHYRIIEIKMSNLLLCADGKHLRNSYNTRPFKGQLYIYNKILGSIQNYYPSKSYIIGHRWKYTSKGMLYKGNTFDRPACINFKTNDKIIRKKTADAIRWIRNMRINGKNWIVYPPSVCELKPNMCVVNDKWQPIKTEIATYNNDITQLWMCGTKNRIIAENNGVSNWKTHVNLKSETLGVFGNTNANILQSIININQDNSISEFPDFVYPKKIKSSLYKWRQQSIDLFVDFETITPAILSDSYDGSFIFMIGVGYLYNNQWKFKCFIADSISVESECKIFIEFHDFVYKIKAKKLWHWSHAEPVLYNSALIRHINKIETKKIIYNWCDLLKLFKTEPIVIKGSLCFKLKSITNALYNHSIITSCYLTSDINNGLDAMVYAYTEYSKENTSPIINSTVIKSIKDYNEIDCFVLWEIITYLRNHH